MKTIGLTGGIATGKSTVACMLRERGVPVVDADQLARDAVAVGSPALAQIHERFGDGVIQPDGSLDRAAMRTIVLADPAARADLEAITHPAIAALTIGWLSERAQAGEPVAVVEAALMVETGSYKHYDALLVVSSPPDLQLRRLMSRNGIDEAEARRWLAAQLPLSDKEAAADEVVMNSGDIDALADRLDAAWTALTA